MSKEDRDAAAAAEREEKKRLDLLRQQEEDAVREAELSQLQAAIDALQAKLDKKTRDADNGGCSRFSCSATTRLSLSFFNFFSLLQYEQHCGSRSTSCRRRGCASRSWWRSSSSSRRRSGCSKTRTPPCAS